VAAASDYAVDTVVEEILGGRPVILPTDTVYGLCTMPYREEPVRRLYRLKGRDASQPTAFVAADVDMLLECIPELRGRAGTILRALLPGPFTVVAPNPARRFRWLTGNNPETIGVRVPAADGALASVLERVSAVAATSANRPGERDPKRLEEIPEEIRGGCVLLDGGELPGVPSTVVDITGPEPRILREGAVPAGETLARVRSAAA
jgi:tRNA threonylcarbamoyl adenosine modification protein (Sua5/YciO/YrdC/YwlC family)